MTTGTLQQSGDTTAQIEQLIATMGGTPFAGNIGELLRQLNSAFAAYSPGGSSLPIGPAGATGATMPRVEGAEDETIVVASGTMQLGAIYLPANTVVNAINFVTGSTASVGVSHNSAVLADSTRKVLAHSADNTSADLVANTVQTYTMTTPFTTTYSGLYYVGFVIAVATTTPTMMGNTASVSTLNNIAPKSAGASNTGVTTPIAVGATLTAITASVSTLYAYTT